MPVRANQRLYFKLQNKLAREELDYQNMPGVSTLIGGTQGLSSKFDTTQYNEDMKMKRFEALAKSKDHEAHNLKDFIPLKTEMVKYKKTEPVQVAMSNMGNRPTTIKLAPVIELPKTGMPQVQNDFESKLARYYLKTGAPNSNTSGSLIRLDDVIDLLEGESATALAAPQDEYKTRERQRVKERNRKKAEQQRNISKQAREKKSNQVRARNEITAGNIQTRARSLRGPAKADKAKKKKRSTNPYTMTDDNFDMS